MKDRRVRTCIEGVHETAKGHIRLELRTGQGLLLDRRYVDPRFFETIYGLVCGLMPDSERNIILSYKAESGEVTEILYRGQKVYPIDA